MRFVVIGDMHYSFYRTKGLRALREEFFGRLFHSVAAQEPDLVVSIGDLVHVGSHEEFEGALACAKKAGVSSMIVVNGNHDLMKLRKPEVAKYTNNPQPYYAMFYNLAEDKRTDANDPAAVRLVVMDTSQERKHLDTSGIVDAVQLDWLSDQVAASGDKPLVVFGHHPLKGFTSYSTLAKGLSIQNSAAILDIFNRKKMGAAFYFCGHNHANSIVRRDNWHFIQNGAPLRTADFRVVDITPDSFNLQSVPIEGGQETQRMALKLSLLQFDVTRLPAKGKPADRELSLQLTDFVPSSSKFARIL